MTTDAKLLIKQSEMLNYFANMLNYSKLAKEYALFSPCLKENNIYYTTHLKLSVS